MELALPKLPTVHQQILLHWLSSIPNCVEEKTPGVHKIVLSALTKDHQRFFMQYMEHTMHPCLWCQKMFPVLEWRQHMAQCDSQTHVCKWEGCMMRLLQKDREKHESDCPFRTAVCPWCKRQDRYDFVMAHKDKCMKKPHLCTNAGCDVRLPQLQLQAHAKVCKFRKMPCKWCKAEHPAHALDRHEATCARHLIKCPHCPQNLRLLGGKKHTFVYAKVDEALHRSCCVRQSEQCKECGEKIPTRTLVEHVRPTMRQVEQLQNKRWFPEKGDLFQTSVIGDAHDGSMIRKYLWLHHSLSFWRIERHVAHDSSEHEEILNHLGSAAHTSSLFHETQTTRLPFFWDAPVRRLYALRKEVQMLSSASTELVKHTIRCHLTPDILAFDRDHIQHCSGCERQVRNVRCGAFKELVEHVKDRACHHNPRCQECRKVKLLMGHHPAQSCGCRMCQLVPCFWHTHGCTARVMLRDRDAHESACPFGQTRRCPLCGATHLSSDPVELRAHILRCGAGPD